MSIGVLNVGVGNIGSIVNSLKKNGFEVTVESSPENLNNYQRLILPGVGSYSVFMDGIVNKGFYEAIRTYVTDPEKKLIGICVGMQALFEKGVEGGERSGFDFVDGIVTKLDEGALGRVPNVGWSYVEFEGALATFSGDYYFTHSYANQGSLDRCGLSHHNTDITAAVVRNNIIGFQFHPEKSG